MLVLLVEQKNSSFFHLTQTSLEPFDDLLVEPVDDIDSFAVEQTRPAELDQQVDPGGHRRLDVRAAFILRVVRGDVQPSLGQQRLELGGYLPGGGEGRLGEL